MVKILLTADWQPDANPSSGGDQYAKAIELADDIATTFPSIDDGIFAGDIVDRGFPTNAERNSWPNPWITLEQMSEVMDRANITWRTIPGNHDHDYREQYGICRRFSLRKYRKVFGNTITYVWTMGNMMFIMMGDENEDTPGQISDKTFQWWEETVLKNQDDYNIVTVTHQSLDGTTVPGSNDPRWRIENSQRFIDAMTRANNPARVDLWLVGHHGTSSLIEPRHASSFAHNTLTVNIGAHIPTVVKNNRPVLYKILDLKEGTRNACIKTRNLEAGIFEPSLELNFQMAHIIDAE